jgi:hypothetical protein
MNEEATGSNNSYIRESLKYIAHRSFVNEKYHGQISGYILLSTSADMLYSLHYAICPTLSFFMPSNLIKFCPLVS